jgi:hypothetical protein
MNKIDNTNLFPIYSRKIALQLREFGFRIVKITPNRKRIELDCYWFENSESFQQAFAEIQQNLKKVELP